MENLLVDPLFLPFYALDRMRNLAWMGPTEVATGLFA